MDASAPLRPCSTTTPTSPTACSRCTRRPGQARWATAAGSLLDRALERFVDADGTVHDTAHDAPALFARPAGRTDNAEPSGVSALAGALLTFAALTGSERHRLAASAALDACGPVANQDPRFAGRALAVAEALAAGPLQVAVVGDGAGGGATCSTSRGRAPHREPSSSPGCRTRPASRSSPAARSSTAGPRPTCAGASSATGRSPTQRTSGRVLAAG